jgi:glycosyltransferase involved in cell wall biosynthesis
MPRASIVIRTKNEGRHLGWCLRQVFRQSVTDIEVIIVDSGSTDDTLAIAGRFPTRVVTIPPERFTYGYALNVGNEVARAPILVSLSGHAIPRDERWLGNLLRRFGDPSVAGAYSRQICHPGCPPYEWLFVHTFPGHVLRVPGLSDLMFNNAAAAIRRDLWVDAPYDETLPACEDHAWLLDQVARGYRVRYAPDSVVMHSHTESFTRFSRRRLLECRGLERAYAERGRPAPRPLLVLLDQLERWHTRQSRMVTTRPPAAIKARRSPRTDD